MAKLKELLKRAFDVWCKMRWLKAIDNQTKMSRHYRDKAHHCDFVAHRLYDRYCELYPDERNGGC